MQIFAKVIIVAAAGVNGLKMNGQKQWAPDLYGRKQWAPNRYGRSPVDVRAPIIQDLFDNWDKYYAEATYERAHLWGYYFDGQNPTKEDLQELFDSHLLHLFPEKCKEYNVFQDDYSVLDDEKHLTEDSHKPVFQIPSYKRDKNSMVSYPDELKKVRKNRERDIKWARMKIEKVEAEVKKMAAKLEEWKNDLKDLKEETEYKQMKLEDFDSLPLFTKDKEAIKKLRQKYLENAPHEKIKELYYKLEKKGKLNEVLQTLKPYVKNHNNGIFPQIMALEDKEQLKLASELQKLDKSVPQNGFLGFLHQTMEIMKLGHKK